MVTDPIMGWEGHVTYKPEGTPGTVDFSTTLLIPGHVTDFSFKDEFETKERHRFKGRGNANRRTPASIASGKEKASAKLTWSPLASSAAYEYMSFVAQCLGSSDGIADEQKYFTLNIVHKEATAESLMKGTVVKTFTMKCGVGEDVLMEAEVECLDYDPSVVLPVTSDLSGATDNMLQATEPSGDVLRWLDCEVAISGTTMDIVTDFEVKVDHKVKGRNRMNGSALPASLPGGVQTISGKLVMDFTDDTERKRLKDKSSFTMTIKVGTVTHTFAGCVWKDSEVKEKPDDPLQLDMPFTATDWASA